MPLLVSFDSTSSLIVIVVLLLVGQVLLQRQRQRQQQRQRQRQRQRQQRYYSTNYFQHVLGRISLLLPSQNNSWRCICVLSLVVVVIVVSYVLLAMASRYVCLLLSTSIVIFTVIIIQQQAVTVIATKSDTIVQVKGDNNNCNGSLNDTTTSSTNSVSINTNICYYSDDAYIRSIHESDTTSTNNCNTTTNNNNHNTTGTITIRNVPFVCVNPYYNNIEYQQILYSSLLQSYTNDTNTILKQLSISLELIGTSNRHSILYEQIQKRIVTLSTIYDIDYTIIKNIILQPFSCQLMLVEESLTSESTSTSLTVSTTSNASCIDNNTSNNIDSILNQEHSKEQYTNYPPIRYRPNVTTTTNDNNNDDSTKRSSSSEKSIQAYDNIGQIIAHLVRDWSSKGQTIRYSLYNWCIQQIILYHSISNNNTTIKTSTSTSTGTTKQQQKQQLKKHHVLIPGAGLGRLAYDISINTNLLNSITSIEALECSISMAATASNIIFNSNTSTSTKIQLHPYSVDYLTNEVNSTNRYETVMIPDIDIITNNDNSTIIPLSYTVTDFSINNPYLLSDYKKCFYTTIVTCYFIDTATNILEYIDLIYMLLSTNGLWINVGPLQWHYNTILQLSIDELQQLIQNYQPPSSSGTSSNNNCNTTNDNNIIPVFEILEWSVDISLVSYRGDDVDDTNFDINKNNRHDDDVDDDFGTTVHNNSTKKSTQKPKQTNQQQPRLTRYDGYYPLRFVVRKLC